MLQRLVKGVAPVGLAYCIQRWLNGNAQVQAGDLLTILHAPTPMLCISSRIGLQIVVLHFQQAAT